MKNQYKIIINNLIKNTKKVLSHIPKRIKIFCILLLVLTLIALIMGLTFQEQNKQKYIAYNGKNIDENKYPRLQRTNR